RLSTDQSEQRHSKADAGTSWRFLPHALSDPGQLFIFVVAAKNTDPRQAVNCAKTFARRWSGSRRSTVGASHAHVRSRCAPCSAAPTRDVAIATFSLKLAQKIYRRASAINSSRAFTAVSSARA